MWDCFLVSSFQSNSKCIPSVFLYTSLSLQLTDGIFLLFRHDRNRFNQPITALNADVASLHGDVIVPEPPSASTPYPQPFRRHSTWTLQTIDSWWYLFGSSSRQLPWGRWASAWWGRYSCHFLYIRILSLSGWNSCSEGLHCCPPSGWPPKVSYWSLWSHWGGIWPLSMLKLHPLGGRRSAPSLTHLEHIWSLGRLYFWRCFLSNRF